MQITFPNGVSLNLAPANFSDAAVELIELTEEAEDYKAQLRKTLQKYPEPEPTGDEAADKAANVRRAELVSQEVDPFRKFGRTLRLMRHLLRDSLVRGGASPEDAETAITSITLDDGSRHFMEQVREALGVD